MAAKRSPSRQKLINAALELFASQGITETTTRQIAEQAGVNEVTLFRQFGNKHGLLLAAIEEAEVFSTLAHTLAQEASQVHSLEQALRDYVDARLQALEAMPEFVRSLVGEAGQYPTENRQSLGRELTQANRFVADYLVTAMQQGPLKTRVPAEKFASLLNSLLLGYAVLEFTSEFHQLWDNREDFLDYVVSLFLNGAVHRISEDAARPESRLPDPLGASMVPPIKLPDDLPSLERLPTQLSNASSGSMASSAPLSAPSSTSGPSEMSPPNFPPEEVADFPAGIVHDILKQSKTLGLQEFALAYVLFGAGLSPTEIAQLQRSHYQSNRNQHFLQIPQDPGRLVPLNQWILGKRYGSANKNPLSQWLKSRSDDYPALFIHLTPTEAVQTETVNTETTATNENDIDDVQGEIAAAAQDKAKASNKKKRSKKPQQTLDIRPMNLTDIEDCWQRSTEAIAIPGQQFPLAQAQQTWCIDMLIRGITPENLSLLTGIEVDDLAPYIRRAQVKRALEQAMDLDRKTSDRKVSDSSE